MMHYSCWSQSGWHEATITAEEMGWGAKSYQHNMARQISFWYVGHQTHFVEGK